jgi:hypothetical protein
VVAVAVAGVHRKYQRRMQGRGQGAWKQAGGERDIEGRIIAQFFLICFCAHGLRLERLHGPYIYRPYDSF